MGDKANIECQNGYEYAKIRYAILFHTRKGANIDFEKENRRESIEQ